MNGPLEQLAQKRPAHPCSHGAAVERKPCCRPILISRLNRRVSREYKYDSHFFAPTGHVQLLFACGDVMHKKIAFGVFLTLVSAIALAAQGRASAGDSLQGAWRVAQVTTTGGPNPRTITKHNPGMILITANHFALVVEAGDTPRPTGPATTLEQLRQLWDPFLAFAGAYEISDTLLTVRIAVHKAPANMGPGAFIAWSYKVDGDTLTLVRVRTHLGPDKNPITWKLTRIE
jgi:hypothetical protein